MRWAILVVWKNGQQEYLRDGDGVARFANQARAQRQRDFLFQGIEDEVQSVNVVPAPREGATRV